MGTEGGVMYPSTCAYDDGQTAAYDEEVDYDAVATRSLADDRGGGEGDGPSIAGEPVEVSGDEPGDPSKGAGGEGGGEGRGGGGGGGGGGGEGGGESSKNISGKKNDAGAQGLAGAAGTGKKVDDLEATQTESDASQGVCARGDVGQSASRVAAGLGKMPGGSGMELRGTKEGGGGDGKQEEEEEEENQGAFGDCGKPAGTDDGSATEGDEEDEDIDMKEEGIQMRDAGPQSSMQEGGVLDVGGGGDDCETDPGDNDDGSMVCFRLCPLKVCVAFVAFSFPPCSGSGRTQIHIHSLGLCRERPHAL
jgi:hypothetical protein